MNALWLGVCEQGMVGICECAVSLLLGAAVRGAGKRVPGARRGVRPSFALVPARRYWASETL